MITWRSHCNGLVLGAFEDGGTPLAGITGPHPNGLYSATFYNGTMERPRELFASSMQRAQAKVERVLAAWERRDERRARGEAGGAAL